MNLKAYQKPILLGVILLTVAAFVDIQYKGKMYQMMPRSIQNFLTSSCHNR